MTVVFNRPYEFVPRDSSTLWPWMIQRLRLVDRYLVKKEGVVDYEIRELDRLRDSISAPHGIVFAPNHCRYADPLVMVWPARFAPTNFYAMASWHLFNKGRFDQFAMTKCGAFSLNREGSDRKSLETAIEVVSTAERPLIMFAEGMTFRTNDRVRPLLDGLPFIARAAARKRAKRGDGGKVVIHPAAIKYLCVDDTTAWCHGQLDALETHLGWKRCVKPDGLVERTVQVCDAIFALNESELLGRSSSGNNSDRRHSLCKELLDRTEDRLGIETADPDDVSEVGVSERARLIRSKIAKRFFDGADAQEQVRLRDDAHAADIAVDVRSYSNDYLQCDEATDTRVVETIQRLQERLLGKANREVRLKCVIQIGGAITVPPKKGPRDEQDPLITDTSNQIAGMLSNLATEARPIK